jgi:hypothetical protein
VLCPCHRSHRPAELISAPAFYNLSRCPVDVFNLSSSNHSSLAGTIASTFPDYSSFFFPMGETESHVIVLHPGAGLDCTMHACMMEPCVVRWNPCDATDLDMASDHLSFFQPQRPILLDIIEF